MPRKPKKKPVTKSTRAKASKSRKTPRTRRPSARKTRRSVNRRQANTVPLRQGSTTFGAIREALQQAFHALRILHRDDDLDRVARMISGAMGGEARFFHNPAHVFRVSAGGDATSVLAALFHDLVYCQVDGGIGDDVLRVLSHHVENLPFRPKVRAPFTSKVAACVASIFGVSPGTQLRLGEGQNEFLSALACAEVLSEWMELDQVLEVISCIELTIPFRGPADDGKSPAELLRFRLEKTNEAHQLGMSKSTMDKAVKRAVRLANQDVGSFGAESGAEFLASTWELVPELNPVLRAQKDYTVQAYREALLQMEAFFGSLDPEIVFQRFLDEPKNFSLLAGNATRNIQDAQKYFQLKLVTLAVLEAVGEKFGRPVALPMIMGELSNLGLPTTVVDGFLSSRKRKKSQATGGEERVIQLLESDPTSQLLGSPLTAFLVHEIGMPELLALWTNARGLLNDKLGADAFLSRVPQAVIKVVGEAVRTFAVQKRTAVR